MAKWGVLRVVGLALALLAPGVGFAAPSGQVITEELTVGARDSGIDLYVRNKHLVDYVPKSDRTVVMVHGASYPGSTSFDIAIDGTSWMDWLAKRGYDVYALDIRGYGRSTRPPEMARPPEGTAPIVDTATAVSDLAKVVEYIQSRRNVDKVSLVGWSWGATVATVYATESAYGRVDRLVLYAPQWLRSQPDAAEVNPESLGAWRLMHPEGARDRWLKDVPEAKRAAILPKPRFDQWLRATLDSDPVGAVSSPSGVRAPNGSAADTLRYWMAGKPRFDVAKVTQPVLVIQGEWDGECPPAMGQALFARLDRSAMKRYVMIGEATHALLLEKNRTQLFTAVEQFLQEPLP